MSGPKKLGWLAGGGCSWGPREDQVRRSWGGKAGRGGRWEESAKGSLVCFRFWDEIEYRDVVE